MLTPLTLIDGFKRRITYLRVSLTDRCNYRCTYCMPEAGVELVPRDNLLSFAEIQRIVRVFAGLGVTRVRVTGGEPTMRRGLSELVAMLVAIPGIAQVVMTTNGQRLLELAGPLARAGLRELNVSLDTLDPARFRRITRRGDLDQVLLGIDAAARMGLPIKLNTVALLGFNDDEVGRICDWAWARGHVPRFIEWMPMSEGQLFAPGEVLAAEDIRVRVARHVGGPLQPEVQAPGPFGPARYFRAPGRGKVGIISALSEKFCDSCNRVRLTANGELHTCLAHDDATDLRRILRSGGTDRDLRQAILAGATAKQQGHEFSRTGCGGPRKHMVTLGG